VRTLLVLIVLAVTVLALIWTQQRRLMYFPFGQVPDPLAVDLKGTTAVTFSTSDGLMLNGWFITPAQPARFTLIVFNGNGGNRAHRAPLARALAAEGFAVLLFDYRGYGGNPGSPTEPGLNADARAALDYLLRRPDVDTKRLVYFGESLGSAVAVELAVDHPPAALILRSPFTSAVDVGQFHYRLLPVRWLMRDRFLSIDRIAHVRAPVLVIAGDRDGIVPVNHSRRLFDAANAPKSLVIVSGADHNDAALLSGRQMIDAVLQFLTANVN
jgi:fermentation-respiration switch protein FrsA (DUF1100 family)